MPKLPSLFGGPPPQSPSQPLLNSPPAGTASGTSLLPLETPKPRPKSKEKLLGFSADSFLVQPPQSPSMSSPPSLPPPPPPTTRPKSKEKLLGFSADSFLVQPPPSPASAGGAAAAPPSPSPQELNLSELPSIPLPSFGNPLRALGGGGGDAAAPKAKTAGSAEFESTLDKARERRKAVLDEGYLKAANRAQMEAIGGLFGIKLPPSPPFAGGGENDPLLTPATFATRDAESGAPARATTQPSPANDELGFFEAANKAQMEAIGGLFGFKPPPPPPPPVPSSPPRASSPSSPTEAPQAAVGTVAPLAPAECGLREPGCLQSNAAAAKAAASGVMTPWGWDGASKDARTAAKELEKALQREGATQVETTRAAADAPTDTYLVRASFDGAPFGLARDSCEFVLSDGVAAFRAASSSGGVYPFSSSSTALKRNRERMLRVRARLFGRSGWMCACPPTLDPFASAKCSLLCSP
jgi:hypothetical protein